MNQQLTNMRRKTYIPPEIHSYQIEIEDPICGGSVAFGDDKDVKVDIQDQEINQTSYDFSTGSGATWDPVSDNSAS